MADVILKNRDGEDVTWSGVEAVKLVTADGGTQLFSQGQAVEGVVITPDFSGGNMPFTAPDGTLIKSGTIKKPDTLTPEHIAEGVDIAGIIGTLAAGGGAVCAMGSFTPTSTGKVTITHNLGVLPDLFIFCKTSNISPSAKSLLRGFCFTDDIRTKLGASAACQVTGYTPSNTYSNLLYYTTNNASCYISSITSETISVGTSTWPVLADTSYFWFAIGGMN